MIFKHLTNLTIINNWNNTNQITAPQHRILTVVNQMVHEWAMWYKLKDKSQWMPTNVCQKFSKKTVGLVLSYQYCTTEQANLWIKRNYIEHLFWKFIDLIFHTYNYHEAEIHPIINSWRTGAVWASPCTIGSWTSWTRTARAPYCGIIFG